MCLNVLDTFSVAINGSLEGYFHGRSGIRQGDPLSPYVFVLCMEVLTCLLNKLQDDKDFSFHPSCEKIRLNHLCFADDLFIFCKGELKSVCKITDILNHFHSLSGLQINKQKNDLFHGGIKNSELSGILDCLHFKEGCLPIRYLGIPLMSRKLRATDCVPLLERISNKLNCWANKWLSYAGRLVLIKLVLYSIFSFWASVILIPKGIIKELEMRF